MCISIGDIDVAGEIIELKYQVIVAQLVIERICQDNPNLITQEVLQEVGEKAVKQLKNTYPNMGIKTITKLKEYNNG